MLDRLAKVVDMLTTVPQRGGHPRELLALSIHEYRQLVFEPWRVVYRVMGRNVHVFLIVDGRCDLNALLARRLLGA